MYALFSKHVQNGPISFKYARGCSDRSGKEFHIYHELILFLDGEATFISEDLHMTLPPFSLVVIPRQTYHQLIIHGDPENYHRCVLQFGQLPDLTALVDRSMKAVQIFPADRQIRFLFEKLIRMSDGEDGYAPAVLSAVLTLLLDEISIAKELPAGENHQNEVVRKAIQHINRNLGNRLSIEDIADVCSISPSSLSHIFKKEMYISLHQFIVKKRLIEAHRRICAGTSATVAAMECGFRDYSGFYKQYKKAFGRLPSQAQ